MTRNWTGFWLSSAGSAFVIFLLVAVFFQSRGRVQTQEPVVVTAE